MQIVKRQQQHAIFLLDFDLFHVSGDFFIALEFFKRLKEESGHSLCECV